MKSPMIDQASYLSAAEKLCYSPLQVLESPAGFYIGTLFETRDRNGQVKSTQPGSRDTGYFASEAAAASYLGQLEAGADLPLRMTP